MYTIDTLANINILYNYYCFLASRVYGNDFTQHMPLANININIIIKSDLSNYYEL